MADLAAPAGRIPSCERRGWAWAPLLVGMPRPDGLGPCLDWDFHDFENSRNFLNLKFS